MFCRTMTNDQTTEISAIERHRRIPLREAARLAGLSEWVFKRHYKHLIHKISTRRVAVKLGDALDLPPPPPQLKGRKTEDREPLIR
jgi:hypothetical protein